MREKYRDRLDQGHALVLAPIFGVRAGLNSDEAVTGDNLHSRASNDCRVLWLSFTAAFLPILSARAPPSLAP